MEHIYFAVTMHRWFCDLGESEREYKPQGAGRGAQVAGRSERGAVSGAQ